MQAAIAWSVLEPATPPTGDGGRPFRPALLVDNVPVGYARGMYRTTVPGLPIICAFNNHVFGLDPATGARLWRFDFAGGLGSGWVVRIAVVGDRVYALGNGQLVCIQGTTGQVIGRIEVEAATGATLLATEERVLVGGSGTLQCFSPDGRLLWHDGFKGEGASELALAHGGIVVQGDKTH
jgi:outer membrane protein assembly factor BamB